jgi:[ribosomal protein S5]-alanine N-acetyltransferase
MIEPYLYQDKLQSKRLHTRFLTEGDADAWAPFFEDARGTRFLIGKEITNNRDRAEKWIQKQLDRYKNHQFGLQALIDIDSGAFVGQCGLLEQEVDGEIMLEVGYHLFKEFRNLGYATEAAQLFKNYGFENLQVDSIVSIIHHENFDSQAVARRNGMKEALRTTKWDLDVVIFRISREEWLQQNQTIK